MSIEEPLGVRIYSTPLSIDVHVTKHIEGLTFRSAVSGGFTDASFKFRAYNPIGQPDVVIWTPTTSAASVDNASFKVLDANASLINIGDRFWVYDSGGNIRFNGDRFTVTGKSSTGGTTTVTYARPSSGLIASGDTVLAKTAPSYFAQDLVGFNKMLVLFNRIQVYDLRTAEVAWEGRIEQPARETEKNVWTIGAIGSAGIATDINRPMFYVDDAPGNIQSSVDFDFSTDDSTKMARVGFPDNTLYPANFEISSAIWQKIMGCDLEGLGRFDTYCTGDDNTTLAGELAIWIATQTWSGTNEVDHKAGYRLNSGAGVHKQLIVGTDFTATDVNALFFMMGYFDATGTSTTTKNGVFGAWQYTRMQPLRQARDGSVYNTAVDYATNGVKAHQIVEDVVGRFLNGSHDRQFFLSPWDGNISTNDVYIDTSHPAQLITGISWMDGTTAKEILDNIVDNAAPDAYWAIWESNFGATEAAERAKYKFEFALWPSGPGYFFTSQDGLTEQPDAESQYNYLWYQYTYDNAAFEFPPELVATYLDSNVGSDVDYNQVNRALTVKRDQATSAPNANAEAQSIFLSNTHTTNSGSITIKRPVQFIDKGANNNSGGCRLLDPWMIRPGKIAKIIDIPPMSAMNDFSYGTVAPNRALDGIVFRVVDVEYSSDDGSAVCSLDEIAKWYVPQQIVVKQRPAPPFQRVYR